MKKTFLILCTLLAISLLASAQIDTIHLPRYRNGISYELMGTGGFMSLNYERLFFSRKHSFVTTKMGIAPIAMTLLITKSWGIKSHFIELGIGDNLAYIEPLYHSSLGGGGYYNPNKAYIRHILHPIIGYVFRPLCNHFFFRLYYIYNIFPPVSASLSMKVETSLSGQWVGLSTRNWMGIGLGYTFCKK